MWLKKCIDLSDCEQCNFACLNSVEEGQGGTGKSVGTGARSPCKSSVEKNGQTGSRKEVMFLVSLFD